MAEDLTANIQRDECGFAQALTSHYYFPLTQSGHALHGNDVMGHLLHQFHTKPSNIWRSVGELSDQRVPGRYALAVRFHGNQLPLRVWEDERIYYITPLESLYTFPSWDWWIEPLFPRDIFGKQSLQLIITERVTPETVRDLRLILARANIDCVWSENLDAPVGIGGRRLTDFRNILLTEMPKKLASELARIRALIERKQFQSYVFILRGGYFVRSILEMDGSNAAFHLLNLDQDQHPLERFGDPSRTLFVDDAIGMGRSLSRLLDGCQNLPLHFASLDAAFPSDCYESNFPSVDFYLPSAKLNIYGCRLFEDNPGICGIDRTVSGRMRLCHSPVRDKFVKRVAALMQEHQHSTTSSPCTNSEVR